MCISGTKPNLLYEQEISILMEQGISKQDNAIYAEPFCMKYRTVDFQLLSFTLLIVKLLIW